MRIVRLTLLFLSLALAPLALLAANEPPPEKVRALLQMLSDPEIQGWIAQQRAGTDARVV